MDVNFVDELERSFPGMFIRLENYINEEIFYNYLKPIADTPAPFQTVSGTRSLTLQRILDNEGILSNGRLKYHRNYKNTGNTVILSGKNETEKQVWLLAHLDVITYLIEKQVAKGKYLLKPICYNLIDSSKRNAVVIGYDTDKCEYRIISKGELISVKDKSKTQENQILYKCSDNLKIRPGMRVCLESKLAWDKCTNEVEGSLDDAAGATAIVLATCFMSKYDISIMCGLTDEEEGLAGQGSQSICRGGARLLRYFDQPDLVICSDIHEAADMYGGTGPDNIEAGMGASFSEKSSNGVGEITPPILYEVVRKLSFDLKSTGILLSENIGGYVSRTEGINAMLRTPMVALVGFLGRNRHFQHGFETVKMNDLVNLTKSIICLSLLTKTDIWEKMGLRYES